MNIINCKIEIKVDKTFSKIKPIKDKIVYTAAAAIHIKSSGNDSAYIERKKSLDITNNK